MRLSKTMGSLVVLLGLAACEDATGTDASLGTVQVAAVGDGGETAASAFEGARFTQVVRNAQGEVEGTVEFTAQVELQTETGAWVRVTDEAEQSAEVDASGEGGAEVFAREQLEATTYTRARVIFEKVEADVTGGLEIGLGGLLTGVIRVDLGGEGEVTVEQPISLRVESGSSSTLLIDLNSGAWLQRADAEARAVSAAEFRSAVRVTATS